MLCPAKPVGTTQDTPPPPPLTGRWAVHDSMLEGGRSGGEADGGLTTLEESFGRCTSVTTHTSAATGTGRWREDRFWQESFPEVLDFRWKREKYRWQDEQLPAAREPQPPGSPRWDPHPAGARVGRGGARRRADYIPWESPRLATWWVDSWVESSREATITSWE